MEAEARKCEYCGTAFMAVKKSGRRAKYCSPRCRERASYEKRHGIFVPHAGVCRQCAKVFQRTRYGSARQFCSKRCAQAHARAHRKGPLYTCKQCGCTFIPKAIDRTTFCGRICADAWKREQNKNNEIRYPHTKIGYCLECGKVVDRSNGRKRCVACAREYELGHGRRKHYATYRYDAGDVTCVECGRTIHKNRRASVTKYCSLRCSKRALKREIGNHRKRARKNGVEYDSSVKLKALMIRDHGRCQMCGHKVKRTRKHSKYRATLVHIVAMSKGGSHTWNNVQLECWQCNTKHGDVTHGNRRLFA